MGPAHEEVAAQGAFHRPHPAPLPNRGVEAYDKRNTARTHAILRVVRAVADRHGRPVAHVALAWLASRPGVTSLLLGARAAGQLAGNLDAAGLALPPEDLTALTAVSAPGPPSYSYDFVREWSEVRYWDRLGTERGTST